MQEYHNITKLKKTETILVLLAILGAALSLSAIPGGNILFILSASMLSCIYMYLGFALFNGIRLRRLFKKESYNGISPLRILGAIVTGFVISLIITGLMFRIMAWANSTIMLITGIMPALITTIVAAIKLSLKKDIFYRGILKRVVPYLALTILFLVTPPSLPSQIRHRDNPEYVKALQELDENPEDEEARKKVEEIEAGFRKMNGEE